MITDERHSCKRPSACQNDIALVVESNIMAVCRGISDEHLDGIDRCTYLAGLRAGEHHPIGSLGWQEVYRQTLVTLGWHASGNATVTRREMYGLDEVELVAKRIASVIGCAETHTLISKSIAALRGPTPASGLLRASSAVSDKRFALRILPVPSLTRRGELLLGAVFVTIYGAFTLSGKLQSASGYPSASDELATGFSMTLPLARFDTMMGTLAPWLEEERRRLWEQIRL